MGERDSAAETEKGGEGDAVDANEPVRYAVADTAGERDMEVEPVALRDTGAEADAEAQGLLDEGADALRRADALPPPPPGHVRAPSRCLRRSPRRMERRSRKMIRTGMPKGTPF